MMPHYFPGFQSNNTSNIFHKKWHLKLLLNFISVEVSLSGLYFVSNGIHFVFPNYNGSVNFNINN